jgi:hypothetical protein
MNDTARDSINYQPADTQGLDDLFEEDANQDANACAVREAGANTEEYVSVEVAAEKLKISVRAVQKRLQKGTLSGVKRQTPQGFRWFVLVREQDTKSDEPYEPGREPSENPEQLRVQDREQDANPESIDAIPLTEESPNLAALIELLKSKDHELEAASYRIGYLEAQLESERHQVKLLTDSQHRQGWWNSFCSWFMGKNP